MTMSKERKPTWGKRYECFADDKISGLLNLGRKPSTHSHFDRGGRDISTLSGLLNSVPRMSDMLYQDM